MKSVIRAGGLCGSVATVLLVGSLLLAQDSKKGDSKAAKPDAKAEAKGETKKAGNRLPNNFARLSLSDDQKKKVFAIQAAHDPKISELEAQLKSLKDKEMAEIEAVLTPEQMKNLNSIRAESKQKQEAAKAAKAKSAEKKPAEDSAKKPAADKK